ncbi:MAG: acyl carrier protein [Clostridiales bacterium]|nr:acyl carrier protein [Clostridiales bacterium]MDY4654776.1 acyl carrier protein [Eubacteriales bacterium]
MVFEKLKEVLVEEIGVSPEEVTMDSNMVTDIGADSLDIVQLLIKMEKEYGFKFSDEEMKNVKTVGDVVRYIEEKIK